MKMTKIQMYLAMFLTMLPTLVTASPIPSLTRDNNVAKVKRNDLKVVVSKLLITGNTNNRDLKIAVYGKRLTSRNFFVIKSKSWTVKCSSHTIY